MIYNKIDVKLQFSIDLMLLIKRFIKRQIVLYTLKTIK